ncbi:MULTISPECIES: ABC transporter permease subunit [unclassified Arthrobacter]|uniref:ABC transporter permease subunit n=1 Tax=unclassified Arthrobacter TaxID=235627 RepID=UPI002882E2FC|nr:MULTISPECIES: ABC transporter permease subunit [unclassified Arthrobacter]
MAAVPVSVTPALRRSRRNGHGDRRIPAWIPGASRLVTFGLIVFMLGILPALSNRDIALSILRSRYSEMEPTPEALNSIREELGLADGPLVMFWNWLSGVVVGDWGNSWTDGKPVLPGMLEALSVSLTLMAFSLAVAVIMAILLSIPTFRRGLNGRNDRTSGALAAAFTSMPEFLLAALLLVFGAVILQMFPPYGWNGLSYVVLPALALGLPGGGYLGRLFSDALSATFTERWVATWSVSGFSQLRIALAVSRRSLPSITSPIGLVLVGLTGGAIAVEQVYAIPGIGRATLAAARSQDMPTLQTGVIILMFLAAVLGVGAGMVRKLILGPALRAKSVPTSVPAAASRRSAWIVPASALGLLLVIVVAGLPRDPFATTHGRLALPSLAIPLGADSSGRDVLARISHGAVSTIGIALLVVVLCLLLGLAIGMFPNLATGPIEITNAAPPIIAGIIVSSIMGTSTLGAAVAVAAVSWAPLAAHTAALVTEVKAQSHVKIAPVLGVGPTRVMLRYVLPGVFGPVFRHAMLRLPGIALALALLGFLGLGPQPPHPEWGLILAEGMPYVERSPLVVLVPGFALVLLSILAVSLSSLSVDTRGWLRRRRAVR